MTVEPIYGLQKLNYTHVDPTNKKFHRVRTQLETTQGKVEIEVTYSMKDYAKLTQAEKDGDVFPDKLMKLVKTWDTLRFPDEIIYKKNADHVILQKDNKHFEKLNVKYNAIWKMENKSKMTKLKEIFKKKNEVTPIIKPRVAPDPLYIVIRKITE